MRLPSAAWLQRSSATGSSGVPAAAVSRSRSRRTTSGGRAAKRITWHRERIVGSCRSSAVPTRMIAAPSGGSSSVFRRQLAASSEKWSASMITATLREPSAGLRRIRQQSPCRIRCSSSPISSSSGIVDRSSGLRTTSMSGWLPASACTHDAQPPHATSPSCGRSQVSDLASASAKVPLPTPGGPTKRYEPEIRPRACAATNRSAIASCPSMPCQAIRPPTPSRGTERPRLGGSPPPRRRSPRSRRS